jgi:hypothetical protein
MLRSALFLAALAVPHAAPAQSSDEVQRVIRHFQALQHLSFEYDREYCGYIGWDAHESIVFSPPVLGHQNSCTPHYPDDDITVFASYHTHGAFDPEVPAEFPTVLDMESDEDEGIDGYIATPGGRLWYVDTDSMTVTQLCGLGCVAQDPNFQPGLDGPIAPSYSYNALKQLEDQM